MFYTSLLRSNTTINITHSLQKLLPKKLPPSLLPSSTSDSLYSLLSKTPTGGVGKHVHQTRWSKKQIPGCYWVVTRTQFKCEGKHGKAWGRLVWRGKEVSTREERIRGSLKYKWAEGQSKATVTEATSTS